MAGVCIVFPPLWYFTGVPADLTHPGGVLRARGVPTRLVDLSARLGRDLLGDTEAWKGLRDWGTYGDPGSLLPLLTDLVHHESLISEAKGVVYQLRRLRVPEIDEGNVAKAREVGLSERNPALPTLRAAVARILSGAPEVVAVALVYPEQRVQLLALARLLRQAGYRGVLVAYGSLHDRIGIEDFAPDLVGAPRHALFDDFDGAVVGEAGSALVALHQWATGELQREAVPNLIWADDPRLPVRQLEDLSRYPAPDFTDIDPEDYATPTPVIDLRMGRGCPWGKCAFCAIQAQQPGFRAGRVEAVVEAMARAHQQLGSRFFRIRDDLVTPSQLGQLADAIGSLPFDARWTVRGRFQTGWSEALIGRARAAGLDEMWMGLEAASPRVRELMDKGVAQEVVERNIAVLHEAGIRTRALCILGFPGETEAEARQTLDFLVAHLDQLCTASITPFVLMRRSPMAGDPKRWGLTIHGDPLPRFARLRYRLRAGWPGSLDRETGTRLMARIEEALMPRLLEADCPEPAHGWLRSVAVRERGGG